MGGGWGSEGIIKKKKKKKTTSGWLCVAPGPLQTVRLQSRSAAFNKSVWRATSHLLLPALVWPPCRVISCPHRCTSCLVSPPLSFPYTPPSPNPHPCSSQTHTHCEKKKKSPPPFLPYCRRHHCNDTAAPHCKVLRAPVSACVRLGRRLGESHRPAACVRACPSVGVSDGGERGRLKATDHDRQTDRQTESGVEDTCLSE